MANNYPLIEYPEYPSVQAWLPAMERVWRQGEHVVLIGQTGSGKTTLARDLLCCRDYVIVLAIKRTDPTIDLFTRGIPKYRRFRDWPIAPDCARAVIVVKTEHLSDVVDQARKVARILDEIYRIGDWCIYVDDTGYVTGTLKRTQDLVILLNQARSSGISVVAAATQPTSVAARLPSETMRQVRHYIIFKYRGEDTIKALANITGIPRHEMEDALSQLHEYPSRTSITSDFLSITSGKIIIVRNPPRIFRR